MEPSQLDTLAIDVLIPAPPAGRAGPQSHLCHPRRAGGVGARLDLLSARAAQIRQVFDLWGRTRESWQLEVELRKAEVVVIAALAAS